MDLADLAKSRLRSFRQVEALANQIVSISAPARGMDPGRKFLPSIGRNFGGKSRKQNRQQSFSNAAGSALFHQIVGAGDDRFDVGVFRQCAEHQTTTMKNARRDESIRYEFWRFQN